MYQPSNGYCFTTNCTMQLLHHLDPICEGTPVQLDVTAVFPTIPIPCGLDERPIACGTREAAIQKQVGTGTTTVAIIQAERMF